MTITQAELERFEELKTLKAWCPEYLDLAARIADAAQRQRNSEDLQGNGDGSYYEQA